MRNRILFAAVTATLLASSTSHAGLLGEQVTGVLNFGSSSTNFFDPANLSVPVGYSNVAGETVTIGDPAVEFGFDDTLNLNVADFTDGKLIITDSVLNTGTNVPFTMTFTFANSILQTVMESADSFIGGGLDLSSTANSITLTWAGGDVTENQAFRAVYDITTTTNGSGNGTTVPEPNVLALAGLGLLALGLARRRKA
jgi:hypothetical protein